MPHTHPSPRSFESLQLCSPQLSLLPPFLTSVTFSLMVTLNGCLAHAECTEDNSHFSSIESRCYSCEGLGGRSDLRLLVGTVLLVLLLLLPFWAVCTSSDAKARWVKASPASAAFLERVLKKIRGKHVFVTSAFKIICNFYQVAAAIPTTYHIKFPGSSASFLSFFQLLNLDLGGIGLPLGCFGLHLLRHRLLFSIIAPFGCSVILIVLVHRRMMLLPILLYVTFFLAPPVSSQAFLAFDCDCFHLNQTHGKAYLIADSTVECGWCSPETGEVLPHAEDEFTELLATQRLAWCAMGVSGIGIEPGHEHAVLPVWL